MTFERLQQSLASSNQGWRKKALADVIVNFCGMQEIGKAQGTLDKRGVNNQPIHINNKR